VLFDDGKVHCTVYDPWLSQIYKQTITWKWTGPLKILQYWYPYLDPYMQKKLKCSRVHFALLRMPHVTKRKIGEKKLANCCDSPNFPKFFTVRYLKLRIWMLFIVSTWNHFLLLQLSSQCKTSMAESCVHVIKLHLDLRISDRGVINTFFHKKR